jgi:hypothetical protein
VGGPGLDDGDDEDDADGQPTTKKSLWWIFGAVDPIVSTKQDVWRTSIACTPKMGVWPAVRFGPAISSMIVLLLLRGGRTLGSKLQYVCSVGLMGRLRDAPYEPW